MKKIKVGVIFGGRSGEHEVSLRSARAVIEAFDSKRYEVVPLAITREGRWLSPADSAKLLPAPARALVKDTGSPTALTNLTEPSGTGALQDRRGSGGASGEGRFDVIFPVLHGTYGEDGTIQGLLEMAGVPYVGCGVLGSSCGMDKVVMKSLFREAGLPICKYTWFLRSAWEKDPRPIKKSVARELGFPCFVKPANLGSSVGISRADGAATLERAVELAARYDRRIIVEEAVDAREIECAVLGNDEPEASLPGEYVVLEKGAEFLDYTEKYSSTGHVDFVVPAKLPKRMTALIQQMAIKAFKTLDCSGLSRVDFFLKRETKELLINEINTMPGLTDVSGYPKMWVATGKPFQVVIDRLVELAFERHRDRVRNATSI